MVSPNKPACPHTTQDSPPASPATSTAVSASYLVVHGWIFAAVVEGFEFS